MGKKEKILRTLDGEYTGYIPVIPVSNLFAAKQSKKSMGEIMSDPVCYAKVMIDCRKKFGYDGLWAMGSGGVTEALGKGLKDKFRKISKNGESVILNREALKHLNQVKVSEDINFDGIKRAIALMKEEDPEEPIFAIISSPASTAAVMMDVGNFYINTVKDPGFVKEVIRRITEPIVEYIYLLAKIGVDVIWNPMPTLSGTCISRQIYEDICRGSNLYFNRKVKECGVRLVAHACGKWDDRMDLLVQEGIDGIHVSECDFPEVCRKYGGKVCMMGDIPSVPVMLLGTEEQVYQTALKQCMTAVQYGSFILSPDCGMPPDVPPQNVQSMCRAARDVANQLAKEGSRSEF